MENMLQHLYPNDKIEKFDMNEVCIRFGICFCCVDLMKRRRITKEKKGTVEPILLLHTIK